MMPLREWLTRLWGTFRRRRSDAELEEELRLHLELVAEDAVRRGSPAAAAARAARLSAGSLAYAIEAQRDQRGLPWLEDLARDLRHAGRTLARARGFTLLAVLSLGLGIGASTAIVTLMDAVLFRTLPVEEPDRLYFLGHDAGPQLGLSSNYPLYERYQAAAGFSGITAYEGRTFRVKTSDGIERVVGQYASGNYHAVVRAPMAVGHGFVSESDRRPGRSLIAVISYDYWISRFGGRADVLGQTLSIADRPVTIVGVTAPGFHGLTAGERFQVTLPMSARALDAPRFFDDNETWIGMTIVGRLASGVREPQALAAVEVLFQRFIQDPANGWVKLTTRDRLRFAALVPAARGTFSLRRQYSKPLWVLMGMVALLLIVACANVAILFLARSADRAREMAVRLSIGAGRGRLIRQLLAESALLALLGGIAGVMMAIWGTGAILSVFAIGPSPAAIDARVNVQVLAATAVVVLLTGIGFGVWPALRSTRIDLAPSLKDGGRAIDGGRRLAGGKVLVVAQVALCVVLVTGAGLLSGSLSRLQSFDAGFSRDRVMLANVDITGAGLSPENRLRLFSEMLERIRNVRGVESASLSGRTPIDASSQLRRIAVPGFEAIPRNGVSSNIVTPGYFQTFGLEVTRGRNFTDADRPGTTPVALISESMARHFFATADPIGRTFVLGADTEQTVIVGVVEDARHERLRSDTPSRMVYQPLAQITAGSGGASNVPTDLTISLRTDADPAAAASALRAAVRSVSKDAMVLYLRTMAQQIDATLIPERLLTRLSGWFAGIALVLACVGLYGVMTYSVARRRREIGLRMALGDVPRAILSRVLGEALVVWAIGVVIGLSIAVAATRLLSTFLFGLSPHDPATLAGATGVLLAVALMAGIIPARHAASIDPVRALRDQ
jgi:macrolide transport system ATP-binding/permease protein